MRTIPTEPSILVELSDTQRHVEVEPSWLVRIVRHTLALEGIAAAEISVVLVDDETIHAINREHLDHDWPTDVITFPLSDPLEAAVSAELVVSAETARRVALQVGVEPAVELALYVVHGILHLAGHDDHEDADRARMRLRESQVLTSLGLHCSFTPRTVEAPTGVVPAEPEVRSCSV